MCMEILVKMNELGKHESAVSDYTVIILDIFRATSFIVTALAQGAKRIFPKLTIEDAKAAYQEGQLLAGERFAKKIEGFHLGNSPTQLEEVSVKGKEIVMTTSNGTRAIVKAQGAKYRLIGSFLNLSACSRKAIQLGKPILIYCAGSHREFSLEDAVAAGAIVDTCVQLQPTYEVADDLGMMARQSYLSWRRQGWNQLKFSQAGQRVEALGLQQDLDFCLQVDRFSLVPIVTKNGYIQVN